ncbi:MAG: NAD/NADP octopine/nopaline dehydrogenase family protein [Spirochaetales bacterium]|nr:NAD/NADP octopine/nopaline dehydrogenase family protein [Spirochaetales bacterium]
MDKITKVAVIGAGNGGFMSAADMAGMGYEVALYSRFDEEIRGVREKGGIEVLDIDSKPTGMFGKVALATTDMAEALHGAQVILNPVPYYGCENCARLAAPYLEEGQVVIYLGKGGASLTWAKVLREMGIKKKVYLADSNTLPYGTSRMGDYQVRLENRTQNLIIATFPGRDIEYVKQVAERIYPPDHGYTIRAGQNPIDSILVDYNAITHTPPMVCNAARLERGDKDFHLFGKKENTPAVVRIIERIDRERMAIGEKLGLDQHTLEEEIMLVKWNPNQEDYVLPLYDAIHTPYLEVCEGPYTLNTRHLTEDIPYGLVTFSSLGRLVGVPTPYSDAIITLAEGLLDKDFRGIGRTVESMGLDPSWSLEQVKNYLKNGEV